MRKGLAIAIIGCGTAGQAAALFLARAGHQVTIFERAPRLNPVGAGLLLQPTGLNVLQRLGLRDRILRLGARIDRLHGVTAAGRDVLDIRYADLRSDLYGLGVHRGALFGVLQNAIEQTDVRVVPGTEIQSINDSACVDASGQTHAPFDLFIVADGARSALRRASGLVARDRVYPWGALWFVGAMPATGFDATLSQVYRGTREMIGFLPSGRISRDAEPATISAFWSVGVRDVAAIRAAGLDSWKDRVRSLAPHAEPILEQVRSINQLIFAEYRDVALRRSHTGRVVFIGDAAHAMSPQLGQGANLALMDAAALADALDASPDIPTALAVADRVRRANVRFYQFASRWLTPWFQSDHDWLAAPRDAFGASLCEIEWYRDQMLKSLIGVKCGFFSELPASQRPTEPIASHGDGGSSGPSGS